MGAGSGFEGQGVTALATLTRRGAAGSLAAMNQNLDRETFDALVARARTAQPADAVALFTQALALDPAQPRVLKEMAAVAAPAGQRAAAIRVAEDCFNRCEGNPTPQLKTAFVLHALGAATSAVKGVVGLAARGVDADACAKALNYVIPGADVTLPETVTALGMLLRHGYASAGHAATFSAFVRARLKDRDPDDAAFLAAPVFRDPLFVAGLRVFIVVDRFVEQHLTRLRSLLAQSVGADGALPPERADLRPALMALAEQCFANEYVWDESAGDTRQRARLAAMLETARASDAAAMLGCYMPLCDLPAAALPDASPGDDAWASVRRRQVEEPARERTITAGIPALTPVTDTVSLAVRDQYQENPYPRWIVPSRAEPMAPPRPPGAAALPADARLDILVAGCGTGHHAIQVADVYPRARILAVDLSRTSLAYAIRKTAELGIGRISYFQADILKLARLNLRFDVIECGGVLHHLHNPAAGLDVLCGLLKPEGIMRLALYSRIARHKIIAAQDLRAREGITATLAGIRRFRRQLFALPSGHPAAAMSYPDLFSASGCRDLLFHVQETNLDIPGLARLLSGSGLTFAGFDNLTREAQADYRAAHAGDPAMTSLANWDAFERAHPDTFINMYQFWAYKTPHAGH